MGQFFDGRSLRSLFLLLFAETFMSGPGRDLTCGAAVYHGRTARTRQENHAFLVLVAARAAQNYILRRPLPICFG